LIFVDTTFWVGDADTNDDFHDSSHPVIEAIRTGKTPSALTTDFVLDETVTILGKRKGFGADKAAKVAEGILYSPRVFTVYVDEALLKQSLKLYPGHKGDLSLTDVTSLVVMRRYGVGRIFSHDHDFEGLEGIKRNESL
jgi:predicted nucleic acid-binding protein